MLPWPPQIVIQLGTKRSDPWARGGMQGTSRSNLSMSYWTKWFLYQVYPSITVPLSSALSRSGNHEYIVSFNKINVSVCTREQDTVFVFLRCDKFQDDSSVAFPTSRHLDFNRKLSHCLERNSRLQVGNNTILSFLNFFSPYCLASCYWRSIYSLYGSGQHFLEQHIQG